MNLSLKQIFGILVLGVFLFAACAKTEDANREEISQTNQLNETREAQTVRDDVEELGKIVKLPVQPAEATFREDNIRTTNEKKLTAVLKFSASDAEQITTAVEEKYKNAAEIEPEDWFPAELIAQSQLSGDETLRGSVFAANDFYQAPYTDGKLTRIADTNYFVLELAAPAAP